MKYLEYSIDDLSREIRNKNIPISDVVVASLDRAESLLRKYNAFIELFRESALKQADVLQKEIDAGHWRGPLHGIPLAYKDCFLRKDRSPTVGSKVPIEHSNMDAYVVSALGKMGAIDIGALNLSEMCAGPCGLNIHFGDCRNAWAPTRISGGSSSGSAVSVASYQVYGALGTDTGGSLRIPSALNGVYSMKPTFGLIPNTGCFPRAFSLDCIGPIARSVQDCEIIFDQLVGPENLKYSEKTSEEIKISVINTDLDINPAIEKRFSDMKNLLATAFQLTPSVKFSSIEVCYTMGDIIAKCEAAAVHKKFMKKYPSLYSSEVYSRTEVGLHISATMYIEAIGSRSYIVQDFIKKSFTNADILMMPCVPIPVPLINEVKYADDRAAQEMIKGMTLLTRPFNYLGLPVLSMPIGIDDNGMPVGAQLIGKPFEEKMLFNAARQMADILKFKNMPYQ